MSTATEEAAPARPPGFRRVLAISEFRALFATGVLSLVGDELARVALTILVYSRTTSPLLAALTFGISYVPWVVGGPLLSALADRLPRKPVLIALDVARALLVGVLALPGLPLPVVLVVLLVVALGAPPFEAARSALVADVAQGEDYAPANALGGAGRMFAGVLGFVAGGLLVAAITATGALLVDAATFLVSAAWLAASLRRRPAPVREAGATRTGWSTDTREGLRYLAGLPRLRAILVLLWVASFFAWAPEGIAAPLAAELHEGRGWGTGVLLGAGALGSMTGMLTVSTRVRPERRERSVTPLVVLSLVPLVLAGLLAATAPPGAVTFTVVAVLLGISGVGAAWTVPLNVLFVAAVAPEFRGRAFGVAAGGLWALQAVSVVVAGLLAGFLPAGVVIAVMGAVGLVAVVVPLVRFARSGALVGSGAAVAPAAGSSGA